MPINCRSLKHPFCPINNKGSSSGFKCSQIVSETISCELWSNQKCSSCVYNLRFPIMHLLFSPLHSVQGHDGMDALSEAQYILDRLLFCQVSPILYPYFERFIMKRWQDWQTKMDMEVLSLSTPSNKNSKMCVFVLDGFLFLSRVSKKTE